MALSILLRLQQTHLTNPTMHQTNYPQSTFCNRNVHTCVNFCYTTVHCVTWDWCNEGYGIGEFWDCYNIGWGCGIYLNWNLAKSHSSTTSILVVNLFQSCVFNEIKIPKRCDNCEIAYGKRVNIFDIFIWPNRAQLTFLFMNFRVVIP